MGDEESNYKVEYLDLPEDSTEEKEFVWVARAGKARVTYNSGSVYEGDFNDEKMKHGAARRRPPSVARPRAAAAPSTGRPARSAPRRAGLEVLSFPAQARASSCG